LVSTTLTDTCAADPSGRRICTRAFATSRRSEDLRHPACELAVGPQFRRIAVRVRRVDEHVRPCPANAGFVSGRWPDAGVPKATPATWGFAVARDVTRWPAVPSIAAKGGALRIARERLAVDGSAAVDGDPVRAPVVRRNESDAGHRDQLSTSVSAS
jgi:hypothetical protein